MSWVALSDIEEISREPDGDTHFNEKQEIRADNIVDEQQNETESEISLMVNPIILSNGSGDSEDGGRL